jgi:small subunit ribosomal protein S17
MKEKSNLRTRQGLVVSRSGDKSIKVTIDYITKHPKYGKYIRRSTNLGVHDASNQASVGDLVEIVKCRPISKTKSHRLVRVIKKTAGS